MSIKVTVLQEETLARLKGKILKLVNEGWVTVGEITHRTNTCGLYERYLQVLQKFEEIEVKENKTFLEKLYVIGLPILSLCVMVIIGFFSVLSYIDLRMAGLV